MGRDLHPTVRKGRPSSSSPLPSPTLAESCYPFTHPNSVWHARSPYASTHVFVGAAAHLLPKIKDVHAKDPQASLLLLTHPSSSSSSSSPEEYELQGMGVAVLVGTSVERVEPKTGLVLTKDERIIEFDSLTVSLPRSASSSSSSSKKGSVAEAIANPYDDEEEEEEEAAAATTRAPRRKPSWHETQVFFPERFFTPLPAPTKEQGKKQLWALSAMAPPPPSSSSSSSSASSFAATPCDGCSRIVKRKSLSGHGEGLHAIVTSSRLSRTDTWPWVWLARDQEGKGGPLHVVVADGKEALETAKARQQANKHATVVVVGKREGVPVAEFEGRGLAHVDGEVEELDATHAIILLDDARLIEADHIEFIHSSSSSS